VLINIIKKKEGKNTEKTRGHRPNLVKTHKCAGRDGNRADRPTGAYGLAYDRSDHAMLGFFIK